MNNDLKVGIEIKATDKASQAIKEVAKQAQELQNVAQKLDAIGKTSLIAGGAMTAGLGFAVKTAADFESSMKRVKALSSATDEEFGSLSKTARELGASTVFSATEASEAMQFLSMAGYEANEQIDAMPGLLDLAAASQEELGTTADIVSNVISGFGLQAKESSRIADVLTNQLTGSNVTLYEMGDAMKFAAPMSSALGVAIEETSAAIGVLGDAGIKGGMAGRNLNIIMARMTDPPREAAQALEELGVSVLDSSGEFRGLQSILSDVQTATANMTDAQRASTLSQIAGQDAAKSLINLVAQANDKLVKYTANNKIQGTAARVAKEQNESFLGALKELNSAFQELQISTGELLLPSMTAGVKLIKAIVDLLNLIPAPLKFIGVVAGSVAGIGLVLIGGISLAISSLINTLNVLAPTFLVEVVPAIKASVIAGNAWMMTTIRNIAKHKIWTMTLKDGFIWLNANKAAIWANTRALVINSSQGLLGSVKSLFLHTKALAIQKGGTLLSTAANLGFAGSFRALGAAIVATPLVGWIIGLVSLAVILVQNWDKVIAVFKKFVGLVSNIPGLGFLKGFAGIETKVTKSEFQKNESIPVAKSSGEMPSFDVGSKYIENDGYAFIHKGEEIAPAGTVKSIMSKTSNNGVTLHYNPTISILGAGEGAKSDFAKMLKQHKDEIVRIVSAENQRRERLAY